MSSLLSQTSVTRWSYLYFVLILLLLAIAHFQKQKQNHVTGVISMLVSIAFYYCRTGKSFPIVGLEELLFAATTGPIVMLSTAYFLVGELPWRVIFYSFPVANFTMSYLVRACACRSKAPPLCLCIP